MKEFDEIPWILDFFTNKPDLDVTRINRVRNFVFLWSIYEKYACNRNANISDINTTVETLNRHEPITLEKISEYVDYFSNRYFKTDGTPTANFAG